MEKYCIHMIKHDLDGYLNVSMDKQKVFECVDYDSVENNADIIFATAFFDSEKDARAFMINLLPETIWLGQNEDARDTLRVIGFELCKLTVNEDDEVEDVEIVDLKFKPFNGKYKTMRKYWDDGNM